MSQFSLSDKEKERRDEIFKALKTLYGEVGVIEYRFTPTGIGNGVSIYSRKTELEYDLTDMDSW